MAPHRDTIHPPGGFMNGQGRFAVLRWLAALLLVACAETPAAPPASPTSTNAPLVDGGLAYSRAIFEDPEQPCPRWACASQATSACYERLGQGATQAEIERCVGPEIEQCERRFSSDVGKDKR
jgi:hypothetical protein